MPGKMSNANKYGHEKKPYEIAGFFPGLFVIFKFEAINKIY